MNCMDAAETNATTTSAESELEYAWCRRDETCMFVCNVSCHDATWYESGNLKGPEDEAQINSDESERSRATV